MNSIQTDLNNASFLESWLNFNTYYYGYIANTVFKEFENSEENGRRAILIELIKIQNELVETICKWYLTLKKIANKPTLKIHFEYANQEISVKCFKQIFNHLENISTAEFINDIGINKDIILGNKINGTLEELCAELIIAIKSYAYSRLDSSNTMQYIYNKIKHGALFFIGPNTPASNVEFLLIDKNISKPIDTPVIPADSRTCNYLIKSITHESTMVLYSLIMLKRENQKQFENLNP